MITEEIFAALKARVEQLEVRIEHTDENVREVLTGTAGVLPRLDAQSERWRQAVADIVAAVGASEAVGEKRQDALLPHFNGLFLRLQAVESQLTEQNGMLVQLYDLVRARDGGKGEGEK